MKETAVAAKAASAESTAAPEKEEEATQGPEKALQAQAVAKRVLGVAE